MPLSNVTSLNNCMNAPEMGTLLESGQSSGFKGVALVKEKSLYEKLHLYKSDTPSFALRTDYCNYFVCF